jgi:ligand-binding sensor domain-containing protein
MKKVFLFLIISLLIFIGCEEEPPVLPGLKFSSITVVSEPSGAAVFFNNKNTGKFTPTVLEGLEPGFYKIDLKLQKYIDTTLYTLVSRDQQDTMKLEMKENPTDWWQNWNSSNSSLPINSINKIIIDFQDNKWLATNGKGLVKYNGQNWIVYDRTNSGIPDNIILDVALEKNDRLWVTTTEGFARFEDGTWIIYNKNNSNLPDNYINSIAIDILGNIWLATYSGGLVKFDGVTFKIYNSGNSGLPVNRINSVITDKSGNVYCGTHGGGLALYSPATDGWIIYNTVNSNIPGEFVNRLYMDQKNEIWVGFFGDKSPVGVSIFNRKYFTNYTPFNSAFSGSIVTGISVSTTGKVWVSTADAGVFSLINGDWKKYNTANSGIKDNSSLSIAVDRDENKWIGAGGLNKYVGGK